MSTFQGLPPRLFAFFTELEADNSKSFWQANKRRWEHDVRMPAGCSGLSLQATSATATTKSRTRAPRGFRPLRRHN